MLLGTYMEVALTKVNKTGIYVKGEETLVHLRDQIREMLV